MYARCASTCASDTPGGADTYLLSLIDEFSAELSIPHIQGKKRLHKRLFLPLSACLITGGSQMFI